MRLILTEPQKWIVGKQYPVVVGELYYMAIRSEEKLTELMEWQVSLRPFAAKRRRLSRTYHLSFLSLHYLDHGPAPNIRLKCGSQRQPRAPSASDVHRGRTARLPRSAMAIAWSAVRRQ